MNAVLSLKKSQKSTCLFADTDFIQLMPAEQASALANGSMKATLIAAESDNCRIILNPGGGIQYHIINSDHMLYDVFRERLETRPLPFHTFDMHIGQSLIVNYHDDVHPEEAMHDLENNGFLIKVVEGSYNNDYQATLAVSASDLWRIDIV